MVWNLQYEISIEKYLKYNKDNQCEYDQLGQCTDDLYEP